VPAGLVIPVKGWQEGRGFSGVLKGEGREKMSKMGKASLAEKQLKDKSIIGMLPSNPNRKKSQTDENGGGGGAHIISVSEGGQAFAERVGS